MASAAATVAAGSAQGMPAAKRRKPNVLFVFSDQHRAQSMPGEPFNQAIAPNLAAFREQNCSMDQCVSNYPLCSPYRAIFMSGLYPQQSGMMGNQQRLDPSCGPLGETFAKAGYHTGYVGKWHIHGQESIGHEDRDMIPKGPWRMGFEDWHVWANTNDHYHSYTYDPDTGEKIPLEGWQPTRMTDQAIDFLKQQQADKPWMLVLAWNPPHPPFNPPDEERNRYPADGIKFRPNANVPADAQGIRRSAQGYLGAITAIDEEFGRVLKALDETGQAEDTIVVYTSDHGEMMGSQGLTGKRVPYEESVRVPFAVRYPGVVRERHRCDTLFAAVDIYPTLCGLAGVPVPKHCAGRDLSGAMRGEALQEPEHIFLLSQPEPGGGPKPAQAGKRGGRGGGGRGGCPPYRGVRTKTHTYIVADSGRWLLYDNANDPFQMKNLVAEPGQAALMASLDVAIEKWMHSVGDKVFDYSRAKTGLYEGGPAAGPDRD